MNKFHHFFLKSAVCHFKYLIHFTVILSFLLSAASPATFVAAFSQPKTSPIQHSDPIIYNNEDVESSTQPYKVSANLATLPDQSLQIGTGKQSNIRLDDLLLANLTQTAQFFVDGPYSLVIDGAPDTYWKKFGFIQIPNVLSSDVRGVLFDWSGNPYGGFARCEPSGCGSNQLWDSSSPFYPTYGNHMCIGSEGACDTVLGAGNWLGTGRPFNHSPVQSGTVGFGGFFSECWNCQYAWTSTISNIYIIYYGIPPAGLNNRSLLSTNKPKNGSGDSRECAVSGCSSAQATAGDPIDTRTGNFDYSLVDLSLQTIAGPLTFQRSYASLATDSNLYPTDLGAGWTHNQDTRLILESGTIWFKGHTLNQYKFTDNGNQTYTPYAGVLASLTYNTGSSTYTLKASDQSTYSFNSTGQLQNWRNELGYGFDYSYSNYKLYRVTEPVSGRFLQFNYQGGHLNSVNDSASPSRTVSFGYDGNGDLTSFTDVRGKTWTYEYDGTSHRLKTLKDPSSPAKTILTVHYDLQGRADEQFNGKGERIVQIVYNPDGTSTLLDALGRQATDGYDGRNANSARIDSTGYTTLKTYDANFRPSLVKDQNNRTLQYQWSVDGANLIYIKDAAGFETNLQYNTQNHLTQVIDPRNQVMTYSYAGPLLNSTTRQTSTGNITTSYTYTTAVDAPQPVGLLKTITDALNHMTSFTYDAKGQLIVAKDADNKETHFAYDDLGRVTDVTNPLGRISHNIYDPAGNVTKVIQNYDTTKAQNAQNLYNLTAEFTYDNQGRLTQTKNTLGFVTGYTYDDAGRVYQVTDTYGKTTSSIYNAAGQVISIIDPLGHSTGYEYDSAGRSWKIKDSLNRVIMTYAYNPDSTIYTETRPTANGDYIVSYDTYDALKRPTRVSDNTGHWSEVAYDAYGNPLTRTDALGRVTKYEYNDLGLLAMVVQNYKANSNGCNDTNDTNICTEYSYDKLSNLKKIRNANTHETTFDYDVLNRLWKVTNPLGKITEFGYDALGNRTSLKDAKNNTTTFVYDLASRLQTIDYPSGMTDVGFGYDALGRLTGMDDSLGHTAWAYDNLNRISSIADPFNKTVGYGYDDDSKRTSITYPAPVSKTISYQYNTLDQLTNVLDGTVHLVDYSYDIASRLSGVTLANGVTSTPGYDLSGQLTSLTHQKGSTQFASYTYHYNAIGNRDQTQETLYYPHFNFLPTILNDGSGGQSQALGTSPLNPNSLSGSSAYPAPNSGNLLQGLDLTSPESPYPAPESTPSGSDTSFFQKAWDFLVSLFSDNTPTVSAHSDPAVVMSASFSSNLASAPASSQTIDYGFDALNRLTSATYSSGSSYFFGYDKVGNRTSQTVGGINTTYLYDAADRLTSAGGVTFAWDDNGNLLNDGANSYSYDFANRLTAVSGQSSAFSFGYDGLDNRYQQTVNAQTTTYMLDQAAGLSQVLFDGSASYYYGLGRISQQKNGVSDYFLADGLGSVRQLANQNGAVSLGQAFDPFGNSIGQSGLGSSSYGYAGEWTDGTGLQNLRARYYSPAQGRFLTKDPFSGFLNQPSTLNAYAYATNNPILMSDPSGKIAPLLIAAGLGGLIGAGINIGVQLYNMQPTSLGQALRCLNWGEVGVSFGAGAIAGLTGFTVFGGMTALMGTGFFANVAAGAISGVVAGQYGRLTGLVLSGQISQVGTTLLRPQDIVLDAALGGVGGALGYGIQRGLSGIAEDILQGVTDTANSRLASNPGVARQVLSPREYAAGQANPAVARMEYGNSIERIVTQQIRENPLLSRLFQHVGGPNNPDFIGRGLFNGLNFDITTNTSQSIASHLARAYGQGLILATYSRPIGFGVFP